MPTRSALVLAGAASFAGGAAAEASGVTPVQKVIQLLNGMLAKAKQTKHDEEVTFGVYQTWCSGVTADKTKAVADSNEQIGALGAAIETAEADAAGLGEEVAALNADVAKAEGEAQSATELRHKEAADYAAQHADFSESVDAIERAIHVLKSRSADVPQALLQVSKSPYVDQRTKALMDSFLASQSAGAGADGAWAPEANAYEFQSGSVVETLEKLRLKFQDQVADLDKAEMSAKANYEVLMQQLTDNIRAYKKAVSSKSALKAGRLQDAAGAKEDLSVTTTNRDSDQKILSDTRAEASQESEAYEKNQNLRKGEIEAIEKALKILSGSSVSGHADTYLPALLQRKPRASALTQLRTGGPATTSSVVRAAAYLQDRASRLNSRYLAVIANHVQEDPFSKVKKMLKDLIVRLMEEANEEANHNSYCTAETAANKLTREHKTADVEALTARSEELTAEVAQLADQVGALTDQVAELRAQQNENTNIRAAEQATNLKTMADAKEAQTAIGQAIAVLREYYAAAANEASAAGAALLQSKATMKIKQPYQGQQGDSTGVLALLDVIMSDFSRLEAETQQAEDSAAAAHQAFMEETDQDIAVKETTAKHKEDKRHEAESDLLSTKKQLGLTQSELGAAKSYQATLHNECEDKGLSYADRKQQREAEIQSLKEALEILDQ